MGTHELEPYLERPNLHMLPISLVKLEMKSVTVGRTGRIYHKLLEIIKYFLASS